MTMTMVMVDDDDGCDDDKRWLRIRLKVERFIVHRFEGTALLLRGGVEEGTEERLPICDPQKGQGNL